jgi:hypothetical protein
MENKYLLGCIAAMAIVAIVLSSKIINKKKEGFTAVGLKMNIPSNWFIKQNYDPNQWLVRQYVDTIQPECISYSKASKFGGLDNLNYQASTNRFWRM